MSDQILLVEGEADRSFFEEICKTLGLHAIVKVASPKDVGGTHNSKEGVYNILPTWLDQLNDAKVTRLSVIVDADSGDNGGYKRTIDKVTEIVALHGYTLRPNPVAGLLFKHDDGLADFGLWVMPNNSDEGMLEDWIKSCIHPNEYGLLEHAKGVVDALPQPKFNPIHISKAEVATWMAWQKQPGHGLYRVVEDELIDRSSVLYNELSKWLNHIYGPEDE